MRLTLYYHPLASYCHKVLIALYEHGIEFERRNIDLGSEADRAELEAVWPFARFPVLRDHERKRDIPESTSIIEYVDQLYAGAQKLLPAGWEHAHEVRLWDRICDGYVHTPMQAIVLDRIVGSKGDTSRDRATLHKAYSLLNERLSSREWLAGDVFTLADCSATPSLFYAATLEAIPADMPHLAAYYQRLMARPAVRRVLEEARPYFHMYPFAENLPAL
jgi:glutathione S-transferase